MKILLLNDNPVVRKLVALSAQKTKDDLNVVSSIDEIERNAYDLFIVDDALYSDDVMVSLKEKSTFKISLLMATRGNTVPSGFDHVINKPFLPTDLVELFVGIDNNLSKIGVHEEKTSVSAPSIDLDSMLKGLEQEDDFDMLELDEEFDFEEPSRGGDDFEDSLDKNVLDHEEVQELQELLEDTDDDIKINDLEDEDADEDLLGSLEDFEMKEEAFDELDDFDEIIPAKQEIESPEEMLDLGDDEFNDLESLEEESELLNDDEFDDLELQIKKATGELGIEDLQLDIEDIHHDEVDSDNLDELGEMDMLDDLDGFEGINERDMKLALGEEVEEDFSPAVEEIAEPVIKSKPVPAALARMEEQGSSVQGVEALQALLKALANDEVVKSLKGLNISININFGETK